MRRLIALITDTITTALGKCLSGNHVTDLVTPRLPAPRFARTLLIRLTGAMPVGSQVVIMRHMQPAVVTGGAARVPRHYCLRTLRPHWRRMEPSCGASLKQS